MSSFGQQLAFARAITAQRDARLLAADNTARERVPVVDAVASSSSYFVVPRGDLFVVDLDLPEDAGEAVQRAASFDALLEAAAECGVVHVVVASGRPGHRHAYLVLGGGTARCLVAQWCRDRGLDVRDRGIRPPLAPHRDGHLVSTLISPAAPQEALGVLRASVDWSAAARLGRRLMPVDLPARVRSALRHGHGAAGYESPSHARMALAVAVRARGGPRALLETLLGDVTSALGETYRRRPARWQQQELRRLWDKAGVWIESRPALSRSAAEIDRWSGAVAAHRWVGMAGGTDLAVAEALLVVARRAGTTAVGVALADLGVAAGVSLDTARSSTRRLLASGWLTLVAEATARTSRVYRLAVPAGLDVEVDFEDPGPDYAAVEVDGAPVGDLGADLARWAALGKLSMRVVRTLTAAGPLDVAQLAERLRMRRAAVRYHLRKLARLNVVAGAAGAWVAVIDAHVIAQLEDDLGVTGRRLQQRAQVVEARARRAQLLDTFRAAWLSGHRAARSRLARSLPMAS